MGPRVGRGRTLELHRSAVDEHGRLVVELMGRDPCCVQDPVDCQNKAVIPGPVRRSSRRFWIFRRWPTLAPSRSSSQNSAVSPPLAPIPFS